MSSVREAIDWLERVFEEAEIEAEIDRDPNSVATPAMQDLARRLDLDADEVFDALRENAQMVRSMAERIGVGDPDEILDAAALILAVEAFFAGVRFEQARAKR